MSSESCLPTFLSPILSSYPFQAPDEDPAATAQEFLLISLKHLAFPLVSYEDVLSAVLSTERSFLVMFSGILSGAVIWSLHF